MRNTINPTRLHGEHRRKRVHAICQHRHGRPRSSAIVWGWKLFDYHVTESASAPVIGFGKVLNVKCRLSGLKPDVSRQATVH